MDKNHEAQQITVGELVAEGLEREASLMPPGYKERADLLREKADLYRETQMKVVWVWREVPTA
jgi:hypothetical protein